MIVKYYLLSRSSRSPPAVSADASEGLRKVKAALSPRGEIIIDDRGQTSLPGVFAAGDATTMPCKQIVIVMSAGSTAVLGAFDHLIRTVTAPQPVAEAA